MSEKKDDHGFARMNTDLIRGDLCESVVGLFGLGWVVALFEALGFGFGDAEEAAVLAVGR